MVWGEYLGDSTDSHQYCNLAHTDNCTAAAVPQVLSLTLRATSFRPLSLLMLSISLVRPMSWRCGQRLMPCSRHTSAKRFLVSCSARRASSTGT